LVIIKCKGFYYTNKRWQSAQNTRKLIKDALKLLKEKGFNAINVEEITKTAEVAKGTFYICFKKKEDIILEYSGLSFWKLRKN